MSLYIVAAQPNPPGRDASYGRTTNEVLNAEWVEFVALSNRDLTGDVSEPPDVQQHLPTDRSRGPAALRPGTIERRKTNPRPHRERR
jgi:hypothetical protein